MCTGFIQNRFVHPSNPPNTYLPVPAVRAPYSRARVHLRQDVPLPLSFAVALAPQLPPFLGRHRAPIVPPHGCLVNFFFLQKKLNTKYVVKQSDCQAKRLVFFSFASPECDNTQSHARVLHACLVKGVAVGNFMRTVFRQSLRAAALSQKKRLLRYSVLLLYTYLVPGTTAVLAGTRQYTL